LGFQPYNERLCRLRISGKFYNITIINAYAPTEDKDEALKEQFYEDLQKLQDKVPRNDLLVIACDFNAKVGRERAYRGVVGKYSIHPKSNLNREYLCNHAIFNNLTIISTQFQHKRIHTGTWKSPDGQMVNQIDHVLVNKMKRGMIQDVRTTRGPECNSDHFLLKIKVKQRLIIFQMKKRNKLDGILKICIINRKFINICSYYIINYKTNRCNKI
jgi:exonuclease III